MARLTPATGLELRTLVRAENSIEVRIEPADVAPPGPDDVVVRIEAAPVNPSDLGLLFAGADLTAATVSGSAEHPVVTAPIPAAAAAAAAARVGLPLPAGNEGAGTVVAAGDSPAAQALLGRIVAVAGGGMYAQYRTLPAAACLVLPDGVTAEQGASSYVNPMTVLGMIETMRLEDHVALVHTAAASNLGQMLHRVCQDEQIQLVNIVRKPEQEELLRSLGATFVCNSSSPDFMADLTAAVTETGATLAFDAVGGGRLASQILTAMEAAATSAMTGYSRYGSSVPKQVYLYGSLDRGPTELVRSYGMAWGVGGWLLTNFLRKASPDEVARLRDRVAAGLTTTFASNYTARVSLSGMLSPAAFADYSRQATGAKYLVMPAAG